MNASCYCLPEYFSQMETYLFRFLFDCRPQQEREVEHGRKINSNKWQLEKEAFQKEIWQKPVWENKGNKPLVAIYSWPCFHVLRGMNDGEGEKGAGQGGYCHLRRQMIEKERIKEPRSKTGGEGEQAVKLANDRSMCTSSSSSWTWERRKHVVVQLRSWRQGRVRLCCLVGLTSTLREEKLSSNERS